MGAFTVSWKSAGIGEQPAVIEDRDVPRRLAGAPGRLAGRHARSPAGSLQRALQHAPVHVGQAVVAHACLVARQHEGGQRLAANRRRVARFQGIRHAHHHHPRQFVEPRRRDANPARLAAGEQFGRQSLVACRAEHQRVPAAWLHDDVLRLRPQRRPARLLRVERERDRRRALAHRQRPGELHHGRHRGPLRGRDNRQCRQDHCQEGEPTTHGTSGSGWKADEPVTEEDRSLPMALYCL